MHLKEPTPEFISALGAVTPVLPANTRYLEEPRGRYHGQAIGVVRPNSVDEVSKIVRLCNEHRVGIVPYGGGTGLVGGQTLESGATPLVLSLEKMNRIRDLDVEDNILIAEAGVILSNVQDAANEAGRLFPLSLASEGSCQIGGNLSTNAGGLNVLRHGSARDLCIGIEAVLPDGTIFNGLKRLHKDNTGFDVRNLLIGAEGSLGIITAATLQLVPRPTSIETAFLAVPNPKAAVKILNRLRERLGGVISAFELIGRQGLDFLIEAGFDFTEPFSQPAEWMVLLEVASGNASNLSENLESTLAEAFEADLISDAVLAQNDTQRQVFWQIRETIPEANRKIGVISSHDISVPVSAISEFIPAAANVIAEINDSFRINCFGHIGDGNLHYNVYPPKGHNRAEFDDFRAPVKDAIYDLVSDFDGSFSAEHGVGRMKRADLQKYGDIGKLTAMRAIKNALDPNGIMNPGAIL